MGCLVQGQHLDGGKAQDTHDVGARAAGHATRDIVSGAGHDAAHTAGVVPTTMIFVPSAGGLSHNPAESTLPEECAAGAQVLLEAVLDYDRRMADARNMPARNTPARNADTHKTGAGKTGAEKTEAA